MTNSLRTWTWPIEIVDLPLKIAWWFSILVVQFHHLEKWCSSSMGRMTSHILEHKIHVPNHQFSWSQFNMRATSMQTWPVLGTLEANRGQDQGWKQSRVICKWQSIQGLGIAAEGTASTPKHPLVNILQPFRAPRQGNDAGMQEQHLGTGFPVCHLYGNALVA